MSDMILVVSLPNEKVKHLRISEHTIAAARQAVSTVIGGDVVLFNGCSSLDCDADVMTAVSDAACAAQGGVPQIHLTVVSSAPQLGDTISFTVDGKAQKINSGEIDPRMSLNQYIRRHIPGTTGVKRSCGEGGCGACTVMLTRKDTQGNEEHVAVNSCLRPVMSMEGQSVTTTQGMGSSRNGYSTVQSKLADDNGTQCGFCSPGFVMAMHSLLAANPSPTKQEIEDNFDGNICRCTGYRPILNAMSTFSSETKESERTSPCANHNKAVQEAAASVRAAAPARPLRLCAAGMTWLRPTDMQSLNATIKAHPAAEVRLVYGNTSTGVYKDPEQPFVVDISAIDELKSITVGTAGIDFGATVPIHDVIKTLDAETSKSPHTFPALSAHAKNIANVMVRNAGCWAGNFMMAHTNNFVSDLVTIFMAAGAVVTVGADTTESTHSVEEFLTLDMAGKVVLSLHVPFGSTSDPMQHLVSYKINARRQCSHAIVNAAFNVGLDASATTVAGATLVFGGVHAQAVRATKTEAYLKGKDLMSEATLVGALAELEGELTPTGTNDVPYRKSLIPAVFYRGYLALLQAAGQPLTPAIEKAAVMLPRDISSGVESYPAPKWETPSGQYKTKIEAKSQTSGDAVYSDDYANPAGGLFGAFATSTEGNAKLGAIDASKALALEGVVDFLTVADIPTGGSNVVMGEVMFADGEVSYVGQAIGLVVATSQDLANRAAKLVTATYTNKQPVLTTIQDAIDAKAFLPQPQPPLKVGDTAKAFADADVVATGETSLGSQYHMHLETQTTFAVPKEGDCYKLFASAQWTYFTAAAGGTLLNLPTSHIEVEVPRIGGAYGGKITGSMQISCAALLAAYKLKTPVRIALDLETNMAMKGKRFPFLTKYKVGVMRDGTITGVQFEYFSAAGFQGHSTFGDIMVAADNCYNIPNWDAEGNVVKTNTAANTACRAPGYTPAIFFMEAAIEAAATAVGLDSAVVRAKNMYKPGDVTPYGMPLQYCSLPELWPQLQESADYKKRRADVDSFNAANRWTKRGLVMGTVKYGIGWDTANYGILINIMGSDGTVQVNHSGTESGQGINTKVAQVVAFELGCPLENVIVTPTNSNTSPNSMCTGGSITSELNCAGAIEAAKRLRRRLATQIRIMDPKSTWADICAQCYNAGMDLSERYFEVPDTKEMFAYNSYVVAATEVEIDVLSGQHEIIRTDILFDCGQSLNPAIDLGQVQGGFVMGQGLMTTEELVYDKDTGRLTNPGTWDYHVPSSQSIPIDWRVSILDKAVNPLGVLGSKATGEPPLAASACVFFAIKQAVAAARKDAGLMGDFNFYAPATAQAIQQACGTDPKHFVLK